jgi:putative serine protease PepD
VDIANKVINGEQVTHAYIGLSCATVNAQNAQANHLSVKQGAYIAEIDEDGPGAEAGFEVGDIITKIGDYDVTSADGFILAVRSYSSGDTVNVTFVRNGKEQNVDVTLATDEALQEKQEEERKQQEEEYQQQLEQYQQYQQFMQQQNQYQQQGE